MRRKGRLICAKHGMIIKELEYRKGGRLEYRKGGRLEYKKGGRLEYKKGGRLEYKKGGRLEYRRPYELFINRGTFLQRLQQRK